MDELASPEDSSKAKGPNSRASIGVTLTVLGLVLAGLAASWLLKPAPGPPPADIAADPLLAEGRTLYLERCASCHGETGVGDGPVARINAAPPGDLTDDDWKHGDQPEDVLRVIAQGIPEAMPGFDTTFPEPQRYALAAYIYHLAGREVPDSLRSSPSVFPPNLIGPSP